MFDWKDNILQKAETSQPIRVLGFKKVPSVGTIFQKKAPEKFAGKNEFLPTTNNIAQGGKPRSFC